MSARRQSVSATFEERPISRRSALGMGATGVGALLVGQAVSGCSTPPTTSNPPLLPLPGGTGWKQYPNTFFGNPKFTFPQIEGRTTNHTDTWYVQGKLTGATTGREYAFLTIYVKNRVNGSIKFDFHTFSIFDLDSTEYGTCTTFDTQQYGTDKLSSPRGYLGLSFATPLGMSSWKTQIDSTNHLIAFMYDLDLKGVDAQQRPMALVATMDMQDPPAPVGGDNDHAGIITMQGQPNTGSYFQTGPLIAGTITYAGVTEPVNGAIGHVDRQFFPRYAGVNAGIPYSRNHSHEWGSIELSNGTTVSTWQQFNRRNRNAVEPFTGATRFAPSTGVTDFEPTINETILSYVKWPSSFPTLIAPPSPNRYMPESHTFEVPAWDLQLTGVPITPAPAHGLPVEYMTGPMDYSGTLAGQPITGFGSFERTLALYRKWELVEVLRVTVDNLPGTAFLPGGATQADLQQAVDALGTAYEANNIAAGTQIINTRLRPAVATLSAEEQPFLDVLLHDTLTAPAA